MSDLSTTPVCILAGGSSERFGSDKAFAILNGRPLIERVLQRIQAQTDGPVAINSSKSEVFAEYQLPVLTDGKWAGKGPLAGIRTAMAWAKEQGSASVITVAVDLPFLPDSFIAMMRDAGAPSIAATKERWHPVNGIWAVADLDRIDAYLRDEKRAAHGWAQNCGAQPVQFELASGGIDPFWNVNTPQEMAEAEKMLQLTRSD